MQSDNHPTHHSSKIHLRGKLLAAFAALCLITLATLVIMDRANNKDQAQPAPAPSISVEKQRITTLTKRAFEKLEKGNSEEGLESFRAALAIAKQHNLTDDINYLEQQIDYAENTSFSASGSTSPKPMPNDKGKPGYVSQ